MKSCDIAGCGGEVFAAGLCSIHYNRKRTTGTTDPGPRARMSLPERFWRKVDVRGPDECWPWVGRSRVKGYGYIGIGGRGAKKEVSSRVAWMLEFGPIPRGKVIRHKCHNRLCCNPSHLMMGTQADNVADMWEREELAPRGNARLTRSQVLEIRRRPESSRAIASEYGVSAAHIRSIRGGRAWGSLSEGT